MNNNTFLKKISCGILTAAMILSTGFTAVFADENTTAVPDLTAADTAATASTEPAQTPEATSSPEAEPTASPDATQQPSEETMDLRINASVYETGTNGVYRIVFKTGSSMPEITSLEFTAEFTNAVISGAELGSEFNENGETSKSISNDKAVTITWKNGKSALKGAITLCTLTVSSSTEIKNGDVEVTNFTASASGGYKLTVNPDLNVSKGTDAPTLNDDEKKVYDALLALPKVETISFYKADGVTLLTLNDIDVTYSKPANTALGSYDALSSASRDKINTALSTAGTSIISINALLKAAEGMKTVNGTLFMLDAYTGITENDYAVNYEYLKMTTDKAVGELPAAVKRSSKAEAEYNSAVSKIKGYNEYINKAVTNLSASTSENYNTKISALQVQLDSINKYSSHPYYSTYLSSLNEIAKNLRSSVEKDYNGAYKDYMLESIDKVLSQIESSSGISNNLPTFDVPSQITVGKTWYATIKRISSLSSQDAKVQIIVYKNGEEIYKSNETDFKSGDTSITVQAASNINTYGKDGTVTVKCYYIYNGVSYYLGEGSSKIKYVFEANTGFNSGSGGLNTEGSGGTGSSTEYVPNTDDRDTTEPTAAPNMADVNPYTDIADYGWAQEAIIGLTNAGIVNGMGDGEFQPAGNVTREQFCKMVVQMYGLDTADTATYFGDVDTSAWYAPYVAAALNAGFVQGQSDEYFGIGEPIMRQDMATILYRAINMSDEMVSLNFTDNDSIAPYATEAVAELVGLGIMNGYEDGSFRPRGNATRAEAAKVIWGVYNIVK